MAKIKFRQLWRSKFQIGILMMEIKNGWAEIGPRIKKLAKDDQVILDFWSACNELYRILTDRRR